MFTAKGAAAAMVIALLLCAGLVWSADRDRDRLRDGSGGGVPEQQQLRDGSCQTEAAAGAPVEPKGDADRLRDGTGDGTPDRQRLQDGSCLLVAFGDQLQDGTGDGVPDRERDRDPAPDGSCQA